MDIQALQKLCVHLNEFDLPRAIVDFDRKRFVAWNQKFLALTGYSEEDIKALGPESIILQSDLRFSSPAEGENAAAEFFPMALKVPTEISAVSGHLVRSKHSLGYLMLDHTGPTTSTSFEKGRLVGKEQERRRIVRMFHDEISSGLLGAIFKIHMAKEKLKSANSPEAEPVSEASEMLSEAIDKIGEALRDEKKEEVSGS